MLFGLQHPGLNSLGIAGGGGKGGVGGEGGGGSVLGGSAHRFSTEIVRVALRQSTPCALPDSHHRLDMHCAPSTMTNFTGSQHCVDEYP